MEAMKGFQLQRIADFGALSAIVQQAWQDKAVPSLDSVPESVLYTAIGTIAVAQLLLVLMSRTCRRVLFTTVDTVLAVVLVVILLTAILSLPIGAVYIGYRGSILMARSLSDNFPALAVLLKPILAALGQRTAAAAAAAAGGGATEAAAAAAAL